jgi:hypothetical protein
MRFGFKQEPHRLQRRPTNTKTLSAFEHIESFNDWDERQCEIQVTGNLVYGQIRVYLTEDRPPYTTPIVMGILADAIPKSKVQVLFPVWHVQGNGEYAQSSSKGHVGTDGRFVLMNGVGSFDLNANRGLYVTVSYAGEAKKSASIQQST